MNTNAITHKLDIHTLLTANCKLVARKLILEGHQNFANNLNIIVNSLLPPSCLRNHNSHHKLHIEVVKGVKIDNNFDMPI